MINDILKLLVIKLLEMIKIIKQLQRHFLILDIMMAQINMVKLITIKNIVFIIFLEILRQLIMHKTNKKLIIIFQQIV